MTEMSSTMTRTDEAPERSRGTDLVRAWAGALRERAERLTLGGYDLGPRLVLGFIDLLLAWLTVEGLLRSGKQIIGEHLSQIAARWRSVQRAIYVFGVAITVITLCLTIDPSHKLSIGADSWVVSHLAWASTLLSMVGIVVVFSVPLTLLWLLGARDFVPARIEPLAADGQCGVGGYVSFLHVWTILAFAVALAPTVLWIRHMSAPDATFVFSYLIPAIAAMGLIATVVGRFVYNATVLRERYRDAIQRLASTWSDVEARRPAADPTISFIGESWWKLPATLGALLVAIWQALEWTGVSRAVLGALGS